MQRIIQSVQYDRKQIYPDRILIDRYYIKLCTQGYTLHITSYSMNGTETTLLHFYLISMFVHCGECHVYNKELSVLICL